MPLLVVYIRCRGSSCCCSYKHLHQIYFSNRWRHFRKYIFSLSFCQLFSWNCHAGVYSGLYKSCHKRESWCLMLLHRQEYSIQITFREEWVDDRLQYDDKEGTIAFLTLTEPNKIWRPDLFFKNEKKGHFHNMIMPNVLLRIYPTGNVLYSVRISLELFCPMDLKYFPLDIQTCAIEMASCEFLKIYSKFPFAIIPFLSIVSPMSLLFVISRITVE